MSRLVAAGLMAVLAAVPVSAQEADTARADAPMRTSNFPYLLATPNDGVFGAFRVIRYQQAPWDARVTNLGEMSVDVALSTRESYFARADYKRLWLDEGWRVRASVQASREMRFGRSDGPPAGVAGRYNEFLKRERQQGWVDVTRRIRGPLQLALRGSLDRIKLRGDPSEVQARYPDVTPDEPYPCSDLPPGSPCPAEYRPTTVTQTDAHARAALVYDTRDVEYNPNRGLLIEAGVFVGSADDGYTGSYGVARGYISPRLGTRLTARYTFRALSKTGAVGIQHGIPAWEAPFTTLGGPNSHRGLSVGALAGRSIQLAGAEVRHDLLNFGGLGAITLLAFVDGGRVTPEEMLVPAIPCVGCSADELAMRNGEWIVGAGGGLGIRVLRAAQLSLTAAKANGETRWYLASGWSW
jgi:outer membrane protein assembly factor BamA